MSNTTNLPALSGLRKAGILMVALGAETSANVFKHLSDEEVEKLTWEIARMKDVEPRLVQVVVEEFFERIDIGEYVESAGIDYVKDVLERALGADKADEILNRSARKPSLKPFESVRNADPSQLLRALRGEHPQTLALVLAHLPTGTAASVLAGLTPQVQAEVAARVAGMEVATPEVVQQVERALMERLSHSDPNDGNTVGGAHALVEILNQVDRGTERTILDSLAANHPTLSDDVKQYMFVFEDLITLDGKAIQMILRESSQDDLRLALKGSTDEIRELFFNNMSSRASESLRDDLEMMGPVRLKDVEAAQKNIVNVVRNLEAAGELQLRRGNQDDLVG